MNIDEDYYWARPLVEVSSNNFVFADGDYSEEGDIFKSDFESKYAFVRKLDYNKIKTVKFEKNDGRLNYNTFSTSTS